MATHRRFWSALSLAIVAYVWWAPALAETLTAITAEPGADNRTGQPIVIVTLQNQRDQKTLFDLTSKNVGRTMEIRIDDIAVRSVVREPLAGGKFQISGPSVADAQKLIGRISPQGTTLVIEIVPENKKGPSEHAPAKQ